MVGHMREPRRLLAVASIRLAAGGKESASRFVLFMQARLEYAG
jgi:hypothetical protein